jgi:serine/threonine-protein kinase
MGNDFDGSGSNDDDDQPAHPAELSDYYIQETEVTNAEMEAYFRAKGIAPAARPRLWKAAWERLVEHGHDPKLYPAVGISREMAAEFAAWVGGKLPTEAQWEYAARSRGQKVPFVWGNEFKKTERYANVNSFGVQAIPTVEVKKKLQDQTKQGIFDLMGNVREWCRDVWSPYEDSDESVRDPQGPSPAAKGRVEYVVRGGSFMTYQYDQIRTTRPRKVDNTEIITRQELDKDQSAQDIGFRVVLEWPPK